MTVIGVDAPSLEDRWGSGSCIFLGSLILRQSKKQTVVLRSSTEVEYKGFCRHYTTCELTWLKCLLKDLTILTPALINMFCGSAPIIALASNHVYHARTKHIELDCHCMW